MKVGELKGKEATLYDAHVAAVTNDRRLRINGRTSGLWYQDHALDIVNENRFKHCFVEEDNDAVVSVKIIGED